MCLVETTTEMDNARINGRKGGGGGVILRPSFLSKKKIQTPPIKTEKISAQGCLCEGTKLLLVKGCNVT
jgi:hypothetical protein